MFYVYLNKLYIQSSSLFIIFVTYESRQIVSNTKDYFKGCKYKYKESFHSSVIDSELNIEEKQKCVHDSLKSSLRETSVMNVQLDV